MINIETIEVSGFEGAIKGMRNPFKTREKSDSGWGYGPSFEGDNAFTFVIGPKDLELCQKLLRSGGDNHSKFMRMIHVQADVTAPLLWWKQYATYKVATVENSESTMHTIHKFDFELDDFSFEDVLDSSIETLGPIIDDTIDQTGNAMYPNVLADIITASLNAYRKLYLKALEDENTELADKLWRVMIHVLPDSYIQTRTIDVNYQTLRKIYFDRRDHKLGDWHEFCEWIKTLPYGEELITYQIVPSRQKLFVGRATNLITNMAVMGGTEEEILTTVVYLGKLINLDRSGKTIEELYTEHGIKELERKYRKGTYAGTSDNADS